MGVYCGVIGRSTNGPPRAAMQKEMLVDGVPAGKRKSDLMSRRAE